MSLLGAVLWLVATLLFRLAERAMTGGAVPWRAFDATDAIAAASIVLSLALFAYARRSERRPEFILDLGLVYLVLTALSLGLLFHWHRAPHGMPIRPEISWIGALVLIFAAVVPNAPTKILVASLIAVSMNPIGMLISRARGIWDFGSATDAVLMHYPDYLLAGVAVVLSQVVTKLGQQVTRAREMGSYELGDLLGRGGMGEVYRATHRMLARPAAIKLIRPEMLGGDREDAQLAVKRFRREAESAAALRSPHTVEIYDFGVTDDMAPEMALGEEVDGRADIYALGCVTYFLLTGQLVYEGENLFQVVVKHLQDTPVPPSQRTTLPIPPALDAVVLACLVKEPENRMRSAGELRRALTAVDLPSWGDEQAARWWTVPNGNPTASNIGA